MSMLTHHRCERQMPAVADGFGSLKLFIDKNTVDSISMRGKRSSSSSSTSPCAPLRDAYHTCFNRWYADKFVKGHWDKEECVSEWQKYRACLSENLEDKHLIRFLEAEGNVQDDHRKGAAAAAAEVR